MTDTDVIASARDIRLLILDVDGVMTDGQLHFSDRGVESKAFHSLDGLGCQFLIRSGVDIAIITGRRSKIVEQRARKLGITDVFQGQMDKLTAYEELKSRHQLEDRHCAFAGDDLIDLPVLTRCGLSLSVPDAHAEVRKRVDWISSRKAGYGAVRDICDLIMQAQDNYQPLVESYLQ